ncbi:MAG TPA: 2-oxoglutarate synthase, partial [Desulfotignum sp.]|nr:2-oxoglutarate synthase [Desulfotignum sp.]
DTYVLKEASVAIPDTPAQVEEIDFKALKIKKTDWALASLAVLARQKRVLNKDMLVFALKSRFNEKVFNLSMETVEKIL